VEHVGASHLHYGRSLIGSNTMTTTYQSYELKIIMDSILKLQRWWKQVSRIKSRTISAISIQSSIHGWNARRTSWKKRQSVSKIQVTFIYYLCFTYKASFLFFQGFLQLQLISLCFFNCSDGGEIFYFLN